MPAQLLLKLLQHACYSRISTIIEHPSIQLLTSINWLKPFVMINEGDVKMATSMMDSSNTMRTGDCLTSKMLWNWETIDSCLISRQWHIKTQAQFAATCLAVISLGMTLQLLRRLTKEYDSVILKSHQKKIEERKHRTSRSSDASAQSHTTLTNKMSNFIHHASDPLRFRPSPVQQLIRASLHLSQFIVAYFIML